MKRRAGFTLTELLVVIGIAMLVMAMGAIGFRDALQNQRIKGAASEMQAVIIRSRAAAVTNSTIYYGRITVADGKYELRTAVGGGGTVVGKAVLLPEAVSILTPSSDGDITFRTDGTINWSWSVTDNDDEDIKSGSTSDLKLKDRSGAVANFNLVQNTGAVRFYIQ